MVVSYEIDQVRAIVAMHVHYSAQVTLGQSGGIILFIARLAGIYGDVNHPCPWTTPLNSGWFTAINPWPRAIIKM